jgi:hypothetical protein
VKVPPMSEPIRARLMPKPQARARTDGAPVVSGLV